MKALSVNKAKETLNELVKKVASEHEPICIQGEDGSAVLLNEDDWNAVQETLYLLSIPGMRESIREGLQTPIEKCCEGLNL